MPDKDRSRRHCLTLQALDPRTGSMGEVLVSYDRMQAVAKRSMGHAKECAYLVPAVFEGLCRDEDEDQRGVGWRCYCGVPEQAYRADGSERPPYLGQVFLVFVNEEGIAYNWRWEKADAAEPQLPENHAQRFQERLI